MAAQMRPRFRDLPDVDWASFTDGEVPTYDSGTDTITGETGGGGGGAPTGAAGGVLSGTYPNPGFDEDMATQAELDAHADDPSFVHGITNTADLATDAEVAAAVSAHESDTSVHGIANTTLLATDEEVATAVDAHATDTSTHGIADTTALATDAEVAAAVAAHESDTTVHGVDTANVPSAGQKAALAGSSGTPGGSNRFVTEDDPAVGAADLSSTVIKAPADSARNVVQPTAGGVTPLTLQGHATQSYPLQEFRNAADEVMTSIQPNGQVWVEDPDTSGAYIYPNGGVSIYAPDADPSTGAITVAAYSDNDNRLVLDGTGTITFGDGTAAPDTELARTAAGELSVGGEAIVLDDDARLTGGQPLDSDLTAIAALTTTSYGRSLLEAANAGAAQTTLGVSTFVKTLLDDTDAATARTTLGVSSAPTIAALSNWWTFAPISGGVGSEIGTTTGMVYVLGIFVPVSCTLTGIAALSGPTVNGTAKALVGLHDATGALVANSNLAGQVVTGASTWQKLPFTSTYAATGPALYFAAVQLDGTGTRLRHVNPTDATVSGYLAALTKSVAGTFGTLPTITVPTGPTATIGPVLVTY